MPVNILDVNVQLTEFLRGLESPGANIVRKNASGPTIRVAKD